MSDTAKDAKRTENRVFCCNLRHAHHNFYWRSYCAGRPPSSLRYFYSACRGPTTGQLFLMPHYLRPVRLLQVILLEARAREVFSTSSMSVSILMEMALIPNVSGILPPSLIRSIDACVDFISRLNCSLYTLKKMANGDRLITRALMEGSLYLNEGGCAHYPNHAK